MIERATATDAVAVAALVEAAYVGYVGRIGRRPAPMLADHPALIAAGRVWVARRTALVDGPVDGPVDGLLGVLVLIPHEDHLLVENVAVAPAAQGTGAGSALLSFAEARARALGLAEVRLYTNAAMYENLAWYPRRGFTETHRATTGGYARVHFAKRLD
jgi:ribosomal protein S18 acetylase RimI-like enzyme